MKKIVFLLIIPLFSVYSTDRVYEVGDKFWPLAESRNIVQKTENNSISISLRDNERTADRKTIILLHFNEDDMYDSTGRCKISNLNISKKSRKLGSGGGIFNEGNGPASLDSGKRSFFPDRIYSGNFTVEFWLNSRNTADGETYFLYENYTDTGRKILPQHFKCFLEDRIISWNIKNLFLSSDMEPFSITLKGSRRIIPGKWSHHMLRYNSDTALLEYLYNGIPEAVAHVNREGRESGRTYPFYAGTSSRIELGEKFTGSIDEFRIQGEWVEEASRSRIGDYSGYFITEMIDLKHSRSELFNVGISDTVPPGTDIKYYYCLSDTPFIPDNLASADSSAGGDQDCDGWNILEKGKVRISGGRFLWLKGVLYSDGEKNISPSVNTITLRYDEKSPPPPPAVVKAEVSDGKIQLRWSSVPDSGIAGYLVYIGEKPGHYFGSGSKFPSSPIDAGLNNNIVIDNLENGKVYYMAVSSYYRTASAIGKIIKKGGNYSAEISARPAAGSR